MSITLKLILLFSLLFFIFIVVNNFLFFLNSRQIVEDILFRSLVQSVSFIKDKMSAYYSNVEDTRSASEKAYIRAVADNLYTRVEKIYNRYTQGSMSRAAMEREIERIILDSKIVHTGYSYGMNSEGTLTIHKSSKGESLKGARHIDEMIREKEGSIRYIAVTTGMEKVVAYRYFKPLDLIIAPGVNVEELAWIHDTAMEELFLEIMEKEIDNTRIGREGGVLICDDSGNIIMAPDIFPPVIMENITEIYQYSIDRKEYKNSTVIWNNYYIHLDRFKKADRSIIGVVPLSEVQDHISRLALLAAVILAISIVLLILVVIIVVSRIMKPIRIVGDELGRIARGKGDLTTSLTINQNNELGLLAGNFNDFIDKLNSDMLSIDKATMRFAIFASDISNSSQRLADASTTQAGEMQNILSAVDFFKNELNSISKNTETLFSAINESTRIFNLFLEENETTITGMKDLEEKVDRLVKEATSGRASIKSATDTAVNLYNSFTQVQKVLGVVEIQTGNIENMLHVINDISEQTHILAINASIEAANTGSAGKGFTIIANEIRSLSYSTKKSVLDVKEFLEKARDGMKSVSEISSHWTSGVEQLRLSSVGSYQTFTALTTAIEEIGSHMAKVAGVIGKQNTVAQKVLESSRDLREHSDSINRSINNQHEGYTKLSSSVSGVAKNASNNAKSSNYLYQLGLNLKLGEYELLRIVKKFHLKEDTYSKLRDSDRIDLIHYMEMLDKDTQQNIGYVSNLSKSGLMFLSDLELPEKEELDVVISPPFGYEERCKSILMKIRVVWQDKKQEYAYRHTGASITLITKENIIYLEELIDSIQKTDPYLIRNEMNE